MGFDLKETSSLISFIVLFITFVGLVYKGVRWVVEWFKVATKKIETAFSHLEYVYKEVQPNSGSSLYDKINKITSEIGKLRKDVIIQGHIAKQVRDDMADVSYCEFDTDGNLLFANKKFQNTVQLSEESLYQKGWLSLISEESRIIVHDRWKDSIKTKTPFQCTFEVKEIVKEGDKPLFTSYILRSEQITDDNGEIIYIVAKVIKK